MGINKSAPGDQPSQYLDRLERHSGEDQPDTARRQRRNGLLGQHSVKARGKHRRLATF